MPRILAACSRLPSDHLQRVADQFLFGLFDGDADQIVHAARRCRRRWADFLGEDLGVQLLARTPSTTMFSMTLWSCRTLPGQA